MIRGALWAILRARPERHAQTRADVKMRGIPDRWSRVRGDRGIRKIDQEGRVGSPARGLFAETTEGLPESRQLLEDLEESPTESDSERTTPPIPPPRGARPFQRSDVCRAALQRAQQTSPVEIAGGLTGRDQEAMDVRKRAGSPRKVVHQPRNRPAPKVREPNRMPKSFQRSRFSASRGARKGRD